jgi:hypothetical protein
VTVTTTGALRCSLWARAQELDPAGSAGSYSGYLLVDIPLPWPRDIAEVPDVEALADLLGGSGLRVQAMVPSGPDREVVLYRRAADGQRPGTSGRSLCLDGDLRSCVSELLAGGGESRSGRDLLVCGHGRRDVCCGSFGTDLALQLARGALPGDVRLHRTSHTGGHRFAPTFIVLPEATLWAFADADLVERVLERRGDAAEVADRYRGCAVLGGARVQALEREVLREVGWDLLGWERAGQELDADLVRLRAVDQDGRRLAWEAEVTPGRTMPVPDCGRPIDEARKSETEWNVSKPRSVPAT